MIRQLLKYYKRQILIDVSTQKDYFLAQGKACIGNHRRVLMNIRRMAAWARRNDIPVISTCEVYPNNNGNSFPQYCLDGTEGQKKIHYTLFNKRICFPADEHWDFPLDILYRNRQIILHNRSCDPFDEPRIERLFSEVKADTFIIIGASTETSVKSAALGLLHRGRKVFVVTDAIGSRDKAQARLALRKIEAKGAKLLETKKIAGISHLRSTGICNCEMCKKSLNHNAPVKAAI